MGGLNLNAMYIEHRYHISSFIGANIALLKSIRGQKLYSESFEKNSVFFICYSHVASTTLKLILVPQSSRGRTGEEEGIEKIYCDGWASVGTKKRETEKVSKSVCVGERLHRKNLLSWQRRVTYIQNPLKGRGGGELTWQMLVPQGDQQVVCYQLGAAGVEFARGSLLKP